MFWTADKALGGPGDEGDLKWMDTYNTTDPSLLLREDSPSVPARVNDAQNTNLRGVCAVENDVVANGKLRMLGHLADSKLLPMKGNLANSANLSAIAATIRVALSALPLSRAK